MEDKMDWILKVADRIMPYFSTRSDSLLRFVKNELQSMDVVFAFKAMACDGNTFMVVSTDPVKTLRDIIDAIRDADSEEFQTTLNPITIMPKIADREYMIDMNGTRMVYAVMASVASNNVLKIMACKYISSIANYAKVVVDDMIVGLDEIHPDFDYTKSAIQMVEGGRKKKRASVPKQQKKKPNMRIDVLTSLKARVDADVELSNGIIFVNDLSECHAGAANIIYTDRRYKDAVINYMKGLFDNDPNRKFKAFMHNDFSVPYDFRMTKHSCLVNDAATGQPTYIANLYNIGTYAPVPCHRSMDDASILLAHPIIKLRLLYIDMFMTEHKLKQVDEHHLKAMFADKLNAAYNSVQRFCSPVIWIGYYTDEAYDRIRYNNMNKVQTRSETFYV